MNQQLREQLERAERTAALEAYQRLAAARGATQATADTILGMVQKWRGTSWCAASVDEIQEAEQVLRTVVSAAPPAAERKRPKRAADFAGAARTVEGAACQCRLQAPSTKAAL
ncbi:hypothetical protein ACGFZR_01330 [Streptomyces sp. NPDC048241]|uniref:hypothetical protein n=1 Tax=Streptomyces sp. NPDC048241 TaxID=3365521 RepID=UPI00371345F1